jgi:hypothetical protein
MSIKYQLLLNKGSCVFLELNTACCYCCDESNAKRYMIYLYYCLQK